MSIPTKERHCIPLHFWLTIAWTWPLFLEQYLHVLESLVQRELSCYVSEQMRLQVIQSIQFHIMQIAHRANINACQTGTCMLAVFLFACFKQAKLAICLPWDCVAFFRISDPPSSGANLVGSGRTGATIAACEKIFWKWLLQARTAATGSVIGLPSGSPIALKLSQPCATHNGPSGLSSGCLWVLESFVNRSGLLHALALI